MWNWLRKIPMPNLEIVFDLLGYWAIYLVIAVLVALTSGNVWLFFLIGFAAPAFLIAAIAFACINVAILVLGIIAGCRVTSWAYHRFLWDRFRFHHGAWARSKGILKFKARRRTTWGLLADVIAGFALGVGLSGLIWVPFLGGPLLNFRLLTDTPPWLSGLGWIVVTFGVIGATFGLLFRVASDPLWAMTLEKEASLPPPVDAEFF